MALQNRFDYAQKHYDQDLKYYQRQRDLLWEVRKYISTHVSAPKKLLLDGDLTVQQWLVKLKEDTKPTEHYMATKVLNTYVEAMKGLGKTTKVGQ